MQKPRLKPDAWLQRALEVLREEGVQGVRVERLARDMGVTKGSFYWHFTDREDLLQSILDYWVERFNDTVMDNPDILAAEPAEGMLAAFTIIRAEGLDKYELAMRAWADHDAVADAVVREVYTKRKKFIRSFFSRMGFRGLDAETRTRLTLCCLSWEPNMYPNESAGTRISMLKQQHKLLTKK